MIQIGTLGKLEPEAAASGAKLLLQKLRDADDSYDVDVTTLRLFAEQSGMTLEQLGTDEQELQALHRACLLRKAARSLERFRELGSNQLNDLARIRDYVGLADASLAEIGTSEEELGAEVVTMTADELNTSILRLCRFLGVMTKQDHLVLKATVQRKYVAGPWSNPGLVFRQHCLAIRYLVEATIDGMEWPRDLTRDKALELEYMKHVRPAPVVVS